MLESASEIARIAGLHGFRSGKNVSDVATPGSEMELKSCSSTLVLPFQTQPTCRNSNKATGTNNELWQTHQEWDGKQQQLQYEISRGMSLEAYDRGPRYAETTDRQGPFERVHEMMNKSQLAGNLTDMNVQSESRHSTSDSSNPVHPATGIIASSAAVKMSQEERRSNENLHSQHRQNTIAFSQSAPRKHRFGITGRLSERHIESSTRVPLEGTDASVLSGRNDSGTISAAAGRNSLPKLAGSPRNSTAGENVHDPNSTSHFQKWREKCSAKVKLPKEGSHEDPSDGKTHRRMSGLRQSAGSKFRHYYSFQHSLIHPHHRHYHSDNTEGCFNNLNRGQSEDVDNCLEKGDSSSGEIRRSSTENSETLDLPCDSASIDGKCCDLLSEENEWDCTAPASVQPPESSPPPSRVSSGTPIFEEGNKSPIGSPYRQIQDLLTAHDLSTSKWFLPQAYNRELKCLIEQENDGNDLHGMPTKRRPSACLVPTEYSDFRVIDMSECPGIHCGSYSRLRRQSDCSPSSMNKVLEGYRASARMLSSSTSSLSTTPSVPSLNTSLHSSTAEDSHETSKCHVCSPALKRIAGGESVRDMGTTSKKMLTTFLCRIVASQGLSSKKCPYHRLDQGLLECLFNNSNCAPSLFSHGIISAETRWSIVSWMGKVIESMRWPLTSFFISVHALDEMLSLASSGGTGAPQVDETGIPLLCTACILLAVCSECEHKQVHKAKHFVGQVPNVSSLKDISCKQIEVAANLREGTLINKTPLDFLFCFLSAIQRQQHKIDRLIWKTTKRTEGKDYSRATPDGPHIAFYDRLKALRYKVKSDLKNLMAVRQLIIRCPSEIRSSNQVLELLSSTSVIEFFNNGNSDERVAVSLPQSELHRSFESHSLVDLVLKRHLQKSTSAYSTCAHVGVPATGFLLTMIDCILTISVAFFGRGLYGVIPMSRLMAANLIALLSLWEPAFRDGKFVVEFSRLVFDLDYISQVLPISGRLGVIASMCALSACEWLTRSSEAKIDFTSTVTDSAATFGSASGKRPEAAPDNNTGTSTAGAGSSSSEKGTGAGTTSVKFMKFSLPAASLLDLLVVYEPPRCIF